MLSEEANSPFLGTLAALLVGAAAVAGTPNASSVMITAVTARMSLPVRRVPRGLHRRDEAPGRGGFVALAAPGTIPKLAGLVW